MPAPSSALYPPSSPGKPKPLPWAAAFLFVLARDCGKVAAVLSVTQSFLGRCQTRLLTAGQFRGWVPESPEALDRLTRRQLLLFLQTTAKKAAKHNRKSGKNLAAKNAGKINDKAK